METWNTWVIDTLSLPTGSFGNSREFNCGISRTASKSPRLDEEGKKVASKAPSTIITDGAFNFNSAIRRAYWRENKALAIRHVQDIRFQGQVHNNKMERMNGEIRDREKVVRGVKKEESPLLTGLQIYHNYVRPHMGLNGKTPADLAGIEVKGDDKWLTLIQNATYKRQEINKPKP